MEKLKLNSMNCGDLATAAAWDGTDLEAIFSGTADMASKAGLGLWLVQLHAEACRLAAKNVRIDFRPLVFMNSSCFKDFVTWLTAVKALAPSEQYHIHFVSSPAHRWQKASLFALSCFAIDLVTIDSP